MTFYEVCFLFASLAIVICSIPAESSNIRGIGIKSNESNANHRHRVKIASFKYDYVKTELIIAFFILVVGLFKLLYHQFKYPQSLVPESCLLIVLGTLLGLFFYWVGSSSDVSFLEFDSKVFFFFLLPPIILESAYSLKDGAFIDNLGTILLFAVAGTVLNVVVIGASLIAFERFGLFGTSFGMHALDYLLFASLIAAVDPVAVLSIFKEVGVNKTLYFMVFGESLLNDAVTVVCYNLVNEFKELDTITFTDCFLSILSFLCVSFGGFTIGLTLGVLSSLITKYTIYVRVVEPVICFGMAYLAYTCSELFHFSGMIGIISCGLFQTHYTMNNLSAKSQISINYIIKVISSVSESLIFIILGVMLVNERSWFWNDWHMIFSTTALLLCIVARFLVVFVLSNTLNHFTYGYRCISIKEQIIMAYGGLRGAVSFSLAFMIPETNGTKSTLLSATYIIILFTVFGQGCTMKFLVKCLNIRLAKKEDNFRLFNAFNKGMVNYMTQGVEDIIGVKDHTLMKQLSRLSHRYLRPLIQRDYAERSTEDRLVMIQQEEMFKDNLRMRPAWVRHQMTLESMTETDDGTVTIDLYDEHHDLMLNAKHNCSRQSAQRLDVESRPSNMMTEKEVERLTRNTMQIQALFTNLNHMFYPDRNLVDEHIRERCQNGYAENLHRLAELSDLSEVRPKRRLLLGTTTVRKKVSVTKGMLAASTATVGVSGTTAAATVTPHSTDIHSAPSHCRQQDSRDANSNSNGERSCSENEIRGLVDLNVRRKKCSLAHRPVNFEDIPEIDSEVD